MKKSILTLAVLLLASHIQVQSWGSKKIKGNANTTTITRTTSDYDGLSCAGSGDAEVVSNDNLKAPVSGSGDIEYKGSPTKEDTKVNGSGSISSN